MRSPSSRVLVNTIDIYVANPGRDTDGGVQFPFPSIPTYSSVPCTAQPQDFGEVIDDQGRITQLVEWKIMLGTNIVVNPRDMLVFRDQADGMHTMYVEASRDEAGRGAAFTIRAVERT